MNAAPAIPEHELPDWMKQALRGVDWGVLLVIGLCLGLSLAVWWQGDGLPYTYWADSTMFRAADTAEALREGRLYPRWSPHALRGYGAPIAHFSPPAAPYLIGLASLVLDDDLLLAARLLGTAALVLSGAASYSLAARRGGAAVGLATALLYSFSPYSGLIAPRIQGDFPALLALALWPSLLWALDRLWQGMSAWDEWAVALSSALLALADPRFALVGLLVGLLEGLARRQDLRRMAWPAALGLGLSAFYGLPAWLEAASVPWSEGLLPPFSSPFAWPDLLRPPAQLDPAALLQPMQYSLGWPSLALALLALSAIRHMGEDARRSTVFYGGLGLLLLASAPWWVQDQPWLLGLLALALALIGGQSLHLRRQLPPSIQRLLLALACLGILSANAAVWLSPPPPASSQAYTPLEQINHEIQGLGIAVLPQGAPIPGPASLPSEAAILSGYRDDTLNRFSALPVLANQASVLENSSHRLRFQLRTTNYTETTLILSYFEGWSAWLNEAPLKLTQQDNGLARLSIPRASDEELVISLESSPLRLAAWAITWLSLASLAQRARRRHRLIPHARLSSFALLSAAEARLLLVVLLVCTALGLALSLAPWPLSLRASPGHGLGRAIPLNSRTDQDSTLLGYQLPARHSLSQVLPVTLYWQAVRPLRQAFAVRLSLQAVSSGQSVLVRAPRPPANLPTRRWMRNTYLVDQHQLSLPANLPPGRYILSVEWLACAESCDEDSRATFFDAQGRALGRAVALPQVIDIQR